jgi:hypothetical protein
MASRNPSVTCAADQSPVSCICVTCGGSSTMVFGSCFVSPHSGSSCHTKCNASTRRS